MLLSASAKASSLGLHYSDQNISYIHLHKMATRATPARIDRYRISLQLYKTLYNMIPDNEWQQ